MTHGITDITAGMTHGTTDMEDGTTHGTVTCTHTTADGTEAGTHTGATTTTIIITTTIRHRLYITKTVGTEADAIQAPTAYSPADHQSEEA